MLTNPETKLEIETGEAKKAPSQPPNLTHTDIIELWALIEPLQHQEQAKHMKKNLAAQTGRLIRLKWEGESAPNHDKRYRFVGWERREEDNKWCLILENPDFAQYSLEAREKLQREHGVVYPRLPIDMSFSPTSGGPTDLLLGAKPTRKERLLAEQPPVDLLIDTVALEELPVAV